MYHLTSGQMGHLQLNLHYVLTIINTIINYYEYDTSYTVKPAAKHQTHSPAEKAGHQ